MIKCALQHIKNIMWNKNYKIKTKNKEFHNLGADMVSE